MLEPQNEMGVVVYFAQRCAAMGWEIAAVQSAFPDAVIKNKETGKTYRVEFEYNSASFVSHQHDPRGCDLIICWEDDLNLSIDFKFIPIVTLCEVDCIDFEEITQIEKENAYLQLELRRIKRELKQALAIIEEKEADAPRSSCVFGCIVCGAIFSSQNALNAHMRVHNGAHE